jgi:hypothetical protein
MPGADAREEARCLLLADFVAEVRVEGRVADSRVFKAEARPSFRASPCEQPHALEGLTQQTETARGPVEQSTCFAGKSSLGPGRQTFGHDGH